jgi:hypothetical protein
MFRLAWMAAVLVVALSLAPGRANDPGPSFGGRGAHCSFALDGRLYEQLRLTGHASFGRFEVWAKRAQEGRAMDVVLECRDAGGQVIYRIDAATMELRSGDARGKLLLMRLKDGTGRGNDGSIATFADVVREVRLP